MAEAVKMPAPAWSATDTEMQCTAMDDPHETRGAERCPRVAIYEVIWDESCAHTPDFVCIPHVDNMKLTMESNPTTRVRCDQCKTILGRVKSIEPIRKRP